MSIKSIQIGDYTVGNDSPPFIIAELSGNHGQDKQLALSMIDAAADCGAHAIKLQTYTADSMTLDVSSDDFLIQETDSLWVGESLHALYKKAATPYEWHEELFNYAASRGLIAFSSPFDNEAVDFLDDLGVPCFKIASFELTDTPLIAHAASKGKPLIMSTGMATLAEIEHAVSTAKNAGCEEVILLKCTSTYPAEPVNTNLNTIPNMRSAFERQVGLSDHTRGVGVAIASVSLGATVIEKHFVLDRTAGGVDAAFSLEPNELKLLVDESMRAWQALGVVRYGGTEAEEKSKQYRRSIYVSEDIEAGQLLTEKNLRIVRPAHGLAPKHWDNVIGTKAKFNLKKGHALTWRDVD
jgi:N-acetylneuraminate synthase